MNRSDPNSPSWHWTNFRIGEVVEVYSRYLVIVNADVETNAFYESNECPLGAALEIPEPEVVHAQRELPPYTGYGSEEDSLASCVGSLIPSIPMKKFGVNKIMNFLGKMETENPEDSGREFVVSYYLTDNTVKINELTKRNSGIVGGLFLSRMKLRTTEMVVTQEYFYVGAEIMLAGHAFVLVDADEGTLKHMEICADKFLFSNVKAVMDIYRHVLGEAANDGSLADSFFSFDTAGSGVADVKAFKQVLMKHKASYYYGGPPEQAVLTVMRTLGNKKELPYADFIAAILNPEVLENEAYAVNAMMV
jgi:hypothetical protein